MTLTDMSQPSRGADRPRFAKTCPLRDQRAQGRPDARCTRGLVCISHNKMRTRAYRSSGEHPAFPAQWLYGLCRGRPGEASSIATIARERFPCCELDASFRAPDHTILPSASATLVFVTETATASHRNVRDDGRRPSGG